MRKRKPWAMLLAAAALMAGCGADTEYANDPRPPQLVTITAAIVHGRVLMSPSSLGAGPAIVVVANETSTSQQLTISRPAPNALAAQTGPINPGGTATLRADLVTGVYRVTTADPRIAAASILVGPSRPSSQEQLQLP